MVMLLGTNSKCNTLETIQLNSVMYEPILDLSDWH